MDFTKGKAIDVPPKAHTFNEHDILGDLDRDDKGNVVVIKDSQGTYRDKRGNLTNCRGYLLDKKSYAVIEKYNALSMFSSIQVDERGEIPAPFYIERYNFNPHELIGDFDFVEKGKPDIVKTSSGIYIDKRGRQVNVHGWY